MRILVLCPHYVPDVAPTGEIMATICDRWAARGHQVEVITSLPWYEAHAVEPDWSGRLLRTGTHGPIRVRRWYPFPSNKRNVPTRLAAFAAFTGLVTGDAVARAGRCDVVLAMSPPLTLGAAGVVAARRWRAPFVFNVQDVYPDAAAGTGAVASPRLLAAAGRLERWTYRQADAVTVLSQDVARNVQQKLPADTGDTKVRVISNMVDVGSIRPQNRLNSYRAELGLPAETTVVMYAGNLGHSQPLELVVAAAEHLADRPDVHFVVNGSGVAWDTMAAAAGRLCNLTLMARQPSPRLAEVLAAADVHLVLLRQGLAAASVPSKLYSVLAAGRPVLAAVDPGSEVERVLSVSGAGRAVPPDETAVFCAALEEVLARPAELAVMGRRAREHVEQLPGPDEVAEAYLDLFADLIAERNTP